MPMSCLHATPPSRSVTFQGLESDESEVTEQVGDSFQGCWGHISPYWYEMIWILVSVYLYVRLYSIVRSGFIACIRSRKHTLSCFVMQWRESRLKDITISCSIFSAQIVMYNCLMNSICVGYDLKMARKPPRQEVSRCAVAFSMGEGMWKVGPSIWRASGLGLPLSPHSLETFLLQTSAKRSMKISGCFRPSFPIYMDLIQLESRRVCLPLPKDTYCHQYVQILSEVGETVQQMFGKQIK